MFFYRVVHLTLFADQALLRGLPDSRIAVAAGLLILGERTPDIDIGTCRRVILAQPVPHYSHDEFVKIIVAFPPILRFVDDDIGPPRAARQITSLLHSVTAHFVDVGCEATVEPEELVNG